MTVVNDNSCVEARFKTARYRPKFPAGGVASLAEARQWGHGVVTWYNDEHRHSRIGYVTPGQRHDGRDVNILQARHHLYQKARSQTPSRWSSDTRNWQGNPSRWSRSTRNVTARLRQPPYVR